MVGVGRDLCGSSSPTPLPKQGHVEQVAQDLIQVGSEYLHRRRIHNLSGQPVPVLHHPQSKVLPQRSHPSLDCKEDEKADVAFSSVYLNHTEIKILFPIWLETLEIRKNKAVQMGFHFKNG